MEGDYLGDTEVMIGGEAGEGEGDQAEAEEAWVEPNVVSEPSRSEWPSEGMQGDDDDGEELHLGGKGARGAGTEAGEGENKLAPACGYLRWVLL